VEPAPDSSTGRSDSGVGEPDATPGWNRMLGVYDDCSFTNLGSASGIGGASTLTQSSSGPLTAVYGPVDAR
jgi:hypothetical protein